MMFLNKEAQENELKAMFVVPKKKFKKAHDRNKLKRRMREAYRLQKQVLASLLSGRPGEFQLAFIYISSEKKEYADIYKAMERLLNFLKE